MKEKFVVKNKKKIMQDKNIINLLLIKKFFDFLGGTTFDNTTESKAMVCENAMKQIGGDITNTLMVGDTKFDVIGAKTHGIPCIGVSWGYGSTESMNNAGVIAIVHNADELYQMIINL